MAKEWTLATWNVNSVRVRLEHLCRFLVEWRPDILCLQETKVTDDQFPREPVEALGYHLAVLGQKSYNGVAILSTHPIKDITPGFTGQDDEAQKRLLAATIGPVRVINGYFPNGESPDSPKFGEKMAFYADMLTYLQTRQQPGDPLVLTGDFNVAPEPHDVYDPEALAGSVCFHPQEWEALARLRAWGLDDLFRRFDSAPGRFTWWDYREGAFARDAGMRIDHILTTAPLSSQATACLIEREARAHEKASDHVPVLASFLGSLD